MAEEAQKEIEIQQAEIEKDKKGLSLRTGRVKKRENDALEKEKQLAEWERALNAKYEEVSRIENAKFLEMKSSQENEKAGMRLEEARKLIIEAESKMAEAKMMEEQVLEREKKVLAREKNMRERIKNEVAQGLLKGFLK